MTEPLSGSEPRPYQSTSYDLVSTFDGYFGHEPDIQEAGWMMDDLGVKLLTPFEIEANFARDPDFADELAAMDRDRAVFHLYDRVLHRMPDEEGFDHYVEALNNPREAIDEVLRSEEWARRALTELYRYLLLRDPDEDGISAYLDAVKNGDLASVTQAIRLSEEYYDIARGQIDNRNVPKVMFGDHEMFNPEFVASTFARMQRYGK